MPTFTEEIKPYEFLVRWKKDGTISGAHVGFRTLTFKDGIEIADTPNNVMPVAVGEASGYPLTDILNQAQIDALVSFDAASAERDSLLTEREKLFSIIDKLTQERDAVIAERDALLAK